MLGREEGELQTGYCDLSAPPQCELRMSDTARSRAISNLEAFGFSFLSFFLSPMHEGLAISPGKSTTDVRNGMLCTESICNHGLGEYCAVNTEARRCQVGNVVS